MLHRSWTCKYKRNHKILLVAIILFPLLVYVCLLWYMMHRLLLPSGPSHISLPSPYSSGTGNNSIYEEGHSHIQPNHHDEMCRERRNLVFLKGMKCATNTLTGMFSRFAFKRNLSVALPKGNLIYHNWPYPMTWRDVRPTGRGEYNMLLHHAIYTPSVMHALMPADTVYVSIVRQPFSHLQSVFRYFKVAEIAGIFGPEEKQLVEYFSDAERYERAYTSPNSTKRWCIPNGFSVTRNLMSHCHGIPLGFPAGTRDVSHDAAAIDAFIRQLGRSFELVMIVEHLYESVILLRRLMCWEFKDIVFVTSNVTPSLNKEHSAKGYPRHIIEFHKRWSHVDYLLYDYFNTTLWNHISRHGSEFHREVKAFKTVQNRIEKYCLTVYDHSSSEKFPDHTAASSKWNRKFNISANDCWALGPDPYKLMVKMKQQSDLLDKPFLQEDAKMADSREYKGLC
ncbi:galactose-3-O-sulfotransferase 3 [Elysia marginata]|uniref:Galactose-3-O-sulfotransferase 3 n=1 Tax=Elysia marginata TaxID=1093978 RepID=A0AAV4EP05_9GAST|nr:galactose-3-O-sulfotransferase 3 [Elysia marginata]